MTVPDRTEELIREMLARRAGGEAPADLVGRALLALTAAPRPKGGNHGLTATRQRERRRRLLVATLVVAVPVLVLALLAAGPRIGAPAGGGDPGTAVGSTTAPSTTPAAVATTPLASPATLPTTMESSDPALAVGSLAVVTIEGDNLRVRSAPTTARNSKLLKPVLPAGTRLLIVDGPVAADGYDWYEGQTDGELVDLFGWVATGKDGEVWLAPKGPRCPEDPDAGTVATLNRIDFLACYGPTQIHVTARAADFWNTRLETADCGWVRRTGRCDVDTRWLLFPSATVTLVTDKGNEHQVGLAMPPDLAARLEDVPRQATLLLTISMDAPEAASCGIRDPVTGSELIPAHRAVTACRLQFVVQQIAWRDAGGLGTGSPAP